MKHTNTWLLPAIFVHFANSVYIINLLITVIVTHLFVFICEMSGCYHHGYCQIM